MRLFFHKHRALIGYLLLTAAVLVALELHHDATERDVARRDRESCEQRKILADNQAFVIKTLQSIIRAEVHEDHVPPPIREKLLRRLNESEQLVSPVRSC